MFFESRERARRNPAQYPKTANQTFTEKRTVPSVTNRSQPVKDTGEPLRKRNRHTYHRKPYAKLRLFALACSAIFLLRLAHMLYGWLFG